MADDDFALPPVAVTVDGITHGGDGVGRLPEGPGASTRGMAVFVPGALPGERVVIDVVDRRKRFAFGALREVVEAAPGRHAPPCPFVAPPSEGGGCGGCDLQHATPGHQRELKTRVVREQLQRLGKVADPTVHDCLPVGPDTGYRNRARLHAAADGRLGFHRAGTHDVVPVDPCLVLTPAAHEVLDLARTAGGVAAVEVRGHDRTGARAMVIEAGEGGLSMPEVDDALLADVDSVDVLLRQPDGEVLPFRGDGELTEVVAERTYRFDASCFFQANTGGADALVQHVLAAVGDVEGALTWDLYAGVGLLTLPLAAAGADVVAVEGHPRSARWCGTNADDHRLAVDVHEESVDAFVAGAAVSEAPDVVVLDPPRVGAGIEVVKGLARLGPESIVYVACDVASLARDVQALTAEGYRLVGAQPLDLFPQTHHVEVVATLRR